MSSRGKCAVVGLRAVVTAVVISALGVVGVAREALADDPAPRPNIVVIYVDDASAGQLQKYMPLTKRRFVELGVNLLNFRNAYCTTPLCAPSRACILTGNYAHTTAVHFNEGPTGGAGGFQASGADQDTIATRLQAAGYDTALVGKYMNNYDLLPGPYLPPGWSYWRAMYDFGTGGYFNYSLANDNGALSTFGDAASSYSTDVIKKKSGSFLERAGANPFLLFIAPTAPHGPAIPAVRHRTKHPLLEGAPRPANYANPNDKIGKPDWIQGLTWTPGEADSDDSFYVNQTRCMAAVDEMAAALIDHLESRGELTDTIFFITTDNGFSHGEHFWRGKGTAYDTSSRTSLVVASRTLIPTGNADRPQIIGQIDISATILELAGATGGSPIAGRSFVSTLTDPDAWPREDLLLERRSKNPSGEGTPANPIPTWNGLVARRNDILWKYVEIPVGLVNRELYDLTNDPDELVNLALAPEHAALVTELSQRLLESQSE